jgi:hypothetical protein
MPAPTAITASREFQPIVKYSRRTPDRTVAVFDADSFILRIYLIITGFRNANVAIGISRSATTGPTTFFYLDPPYYGLKMYRHNLEPGEFEKPAGILARLKGRFLMSLNDHLTAKPTRWQNERIWRKCARRRSRPMIAGLNPCCASAVQASIGRRPLPRMSSRGE